KTNKALTAIRALKEEVRANNEVDFQKYADIISLCTWNAESTHNFWILQEFDDKVKYHIIDRFACDTQKAQTICDEYHRLTKAFIIAKENGYPADSDHVQGLTNDYWNMVMEFTGGDMSLIPELEKFNENKDNWKDETMRKNHQLAEKYIEKAFMVYLSKNNMNLMEGKK
ncbi:MAG: hypothetical protein MJA31_11580, partial [Clostridia bacterium]|nr:hypothetical protein [Clostridia bacterium]